MLRVRTVAERFFKKWCSGKAPDPDEFLDALELLILKARDEGRKEVQKDVERLLSEPVPPEVITPELLRKIFDV